MNVYTKERSSKQIENQARILLAAGLIDIKRRVRQTDIPLLADGKINEEPEFIAPTDGHLFDVNTNSTEEVAKVFLEESEKVTNSPPVRRREVKFSEYNVHARAEWTATKRQFELAAAGNNLIFWISAEDGAMGLTADEAKKKGYVYADGRFNIYFRSVENGEIVLRGKHLPLSINRFKSLELGKRLVEWGGKTLGDINNVEDLRVQPIGFNLEDQSKWLDHCRRMMPELEEFWKMIEEGDDLKKQEEMEKAVEKAKAVAGGDNVVFQLELERMGYRIQSGIHGIDYLGSRYSKKGIYSFRVEIRNGQYFTEAVRVNGKLICPICGVEIEKEESACHRCGVKFKQKSD